MSAYTDGGAIIAANQHPAFEKVGGLGYVIEYLIRATTPGAREIFVRARLDGGEVARAHFNDMSFNATLTPQNVSVDPDHRKLGLANALYVFAEVLADKVLHNMWEGSEGDDRTHSADARALWGQPDRPFGNYPPWWKKQ